MNILESDSSVTGKKITVSNKEVAKRERAADETVVAANIEVNSQKNFHCWYREKLMLASSPFLSLISKPLRQAAKAA